MNGHPANNTTSNTASRRVVAVVYDGLCGFEFGVATELFGLARPEFDDWYEFEIVAADPGPLRLLGGATLQAPADLSRLETAGTIVLPGWKGPAVDPDPDLIDALRSAHRRGARIMSICSGVFVLAATGLLDGLAATTHWRYTAELRRRYPKIDVRADVLFVDNGDLLTSAGSAAGLDLGLHLIRRDFGASAANEVARRLVLPSARDGGQAQFIPDPTPKPFDDSPTPADSVAEVAAWARNHLDHELTVDALAARAAMSPRTFARRFRDQMGLPPHRWVTRQRVVLAQRLLEETDDTVERIATTCGFGSAATLRQHFSRQVQTTPTRYRSTFFPPARR